MLLIHGREDGVGAAHGLVADGDGHFGLNVGETVVVGINNGADEASIEVAGKTLSIPAYGYVIE